MRAQDVKVGELYRGDARARGKRSYEGSDTILILGPIEEREERTRPEGRGGWTKPVQRKLYPAAVKSFEDSWRPVWVAAVGLDCTEDNAAIRSRVRRETRERIEQENFDRRDRQREMLDGGLRQLLDQARVWIPPLRRGMPYDDLTISIEQLQAIVDGVLEEFGTKA